MLASVFRACSKTELDVSAQWLLWRGKSPMRFVRRIAYAEGVFRFNPSVTTMHVVVVGWLYIVVMIAVVSDSLTKGLIRFFFLGVIPVGLWVWMSLRRKRRAVEVPTDANEVDTVKPNADPRL